jgi:hypothetical protein
MTLSVDLEDGRVALVEADGDGYVRQPDGSPLSEAQEKGLLETGLFTEDKTPFIPLPKTPDQSEVAKLAALIYEKLPAEQVTAMIADLEQLSADQIAAMTASREEAPEVPEEVDEPADPEESAEVSEGEVGFETEYRKDDEEDEPEELAVGLVAERFERYFVTPLKETLTHFGVEFSSTAKKGDLVALLAAHITTQELLNEALEVLDS